MRNFDGRLTLLDSGQVFHWQETQDGFAALVNGRVMTDQGASPEEAFYFDDKRDYSAVLSACRNIAPAKRAMSLCKGLRVLNQPAWEALLAFILSTNNNLARIKGLVRAFAREYGEVRPYRGALLYGFPSPEILSRADEEDLRAKTHCGYRAPYIIQTARRVADGFDLEALRSLETEEARKQLLTLPGVGGKVADCVLLFGLGHADAFPVDVWVARLMESWFQVEGSLDKVRREARRRLGPNCGIIQQSLFHAARTGQIELEKGKVL